MNWPSMLFNRRISALALWFLLVILIATIVAMLLPALAPRALAATAPVVTDALKRIQCDPASTQATAFFEKTTTVEGQQFVQPWEPVSWSVGSTRTITYSYGGQSYTAPYAQVMAAVVAIANQERTDPTPPVASTLGILNGLFAVGHPGAMPPLALISTTASTSTTSGALITASR